MRCRIWYADGSTRDSWDDSPDTGVQALVYWTAAGPTIGYGTDTYQLPGHVAIKYGTEIGWPDYQRIIRAMLAEVAPHLPDPFGE